MTRQPSISFAQLGDLNDLGPESLKEAVSVYAWAENQALEAYSWYMKQRLPKARASKLLRALSLILGIGGSLVPFFVLAAHMPSGSDWGYVALGAAAGCLLADRAFGFSTSWSRYTTAGLAIQAAVWAAHSKLLCILAHPPTSEADASRLQIREAIEELVALVSEVVKQETSAWSDEFRLAQEELRGHAGRLP